MNAEKNNHSKINVDLWRWVAIISAAFAVLVCFLLVANYIQINRLDPVNTEAVNTLVQRLSENPSDEALRNEIRALDLLVRKAYFTNQWQVKTGGYIVLVSIAIMLIAFQLMSAAKKINPVLDESTDAHDQIFKKLSRKWISIGGILIAVIALGLSFLTHEKLENTFTQAAIAETIIQDEEEQEPTAVETASNEQIPIQETQEAEETTNAANVVAQQENETQEVEVQKVEAPTETKDIQTTAPAQASNSDFMLKEKQQFPAFRGADGLGIAYQKNIPTEWDGASNQNIMWKIPLTYKGYNSPVIWDEKMFLSAADANKKEIYCYNKNTGALIWVKEVSIAGSPAPPRVTPDTGHAAPTVATDGKAVFAIFSNGDIVALDFDGNQIWAKNLGLPRNHYGHSSSLLIYEGKVIVQYDHGNSQKVLALATADGSEVWSTPRKVKISWASPVLVKRESHVEVVLIAEPTIAGYDVNTGEELWSINCMMGEVGPSVAYADGVIYGINEYASLVAISGGNNPQILWESYDYLSDVPSPIATKDLLFVVTSYGVVVCHNAKTGEIIWEHEFPIGFYSSPIMVGDNIYLIDREGVMQIFKAQNTFELVAQPELGEEVVTTPAFSDGQIFIRGQKHLYGIGSAN